MPARTGAWGAEGAKGYPQRACSAQGRRLARAHRCDCRRVRRQRAGPGVSKPIPAATNNRYPYTLIADSGQDRNTVPPLVPAQRKAFEDQRRAMVSRPRERPVRE